jgi:hypothetical protein
VRRAAVVLLAGLVVAAGVSSRALPWAVGAPVVALLLVALLVTRSWVEGVRVQERTHLFRHEVANHLQTAKGWLQLGRTAEAEAALEKADDALSGWRRVEGFPPIVVGRWSEVLAQAERRGCPVSFRGEGRPSLLRLAWLARRVAEALARGAEAVVVDLDAGTLDVVGPAGVEAGASSQHVPR